MFVDESGSFESTEESSRFYLVCMVFHDQSNRIDDEVGKLGLALANYPVGPDHCAHIGPLIRREEIYAGTALLISPQPAGLKLNCRKRDVEDDAGRHQGDSDLKSATTNV